VVTGVSYNPPLETTTFVQSQPGQPLGTPCSVFPSEPTSVTVTATVAPVNGQVPDRVALFLGLNPFRLLDLAPTSPGSTTWTGTFPIAGTDTAFSPNPYQFAAQVAVYWHGQSAGGDTPRSGVIQACS
jgi:hypothetical protein